MAEVSKVAVKYSQSGARAVQRADENVRESIQRTSRVAEEETGTISRWMERHQTALASIGAAMTGLLAGIVRATPSLNAHLAGVRLWFSLIAMEIGQNLEPQFRALNDAARELYEIWSSLDEDTQNLISKFIGAAAAIGVLAGAVSGLSMVMRPVAEMVSSAANALKYLIPTGAIATIAWYAKNIWNVSKAMSALYGRSTIVTAAWLTLTSVWEYLLGLPVIGTFLGWASTAVAAFASIIGVSTAAAAAIIGALLAIIGIGIWNDRFNILHDTIKRFLGRFTQTFSAWANVITTLFDDLWNLIIAIFDKDKSALEALWRLLKNTVINIVDALAITVVNIIGGLGDLLILIVGGFVSGIVDLFAWLVKSVIREVKWIISVMPSSWRELKRVVLGIVNALVTGIIEFAEMLYNTLVGNSIIPDMVNDIIGHFKRLPGAIYGVLSGFVTGVVNRIKGLGGQVVNGFKNMATNAAGAVSGLVSDVGSTLGSMANSAVSTVKGMGNSLASTASSAFGTVTSEASSMANTVGNRLSGLKNGAVNTVTNMGNSITNTLGGAWGTAKTKTKNLKNSALSTFKNLKNSAISTFKSLSSRVNSIITSMYNSATSTLTSLKNKAESTFNGLKNTTTSSVNGLKNTATSKFDGMKNSVTSSVNSMTNDVTGAFQGAFNTIVGNSIVPNLVNQVTNWFRKMNVDVTSMVSGMARTAINDVSNLASNITSDITGTVNSVTSSFGQFVMDIGRDASSLARDLGSSFGSMSRTITQETGSMGRNLTNGFRDMWSDARSWGSDIVSGFADRLGQTWEVESSVRSIKRSVRNIGDIAYDAWNWGWDIGDELASGLESAESAVRSGVNDIKDTIEDFLSFDRVQNDRMARRWGSDFVQEFSRGLQSEFASFERAMPAMNPSMFMGEATMSGSGGTTRNETNVTIERGAIQFRGGGDPSRFSESDLADEIADRFGSDYGGRTR